MLYLAGLRSLYFLYPLAFYIYLKVYKLIRRSKEEEYYIIIS
jgi:hypothetical protein